MNMMKTFVVLLGALALTYADDPQCTGYDHANYGCSGQCISTSDCPGSKYISNLCPSYGASIKCCFTAETDDECAEYNHPTHGQVGSCISTDQCPYNNYISNLCPTKPSGVKCCFSKPTDTCSSPGDGPSCYDSTARDLACQILEHPQITLRTSHPSGKSDGADPRSNIMSACNDVGAKRSEYTCSSGTAPGGYVCLKQSVLGYILDAANKGYPIVVNSIAGACHGVNSKHYDGSAVDFAVNSGDPSGVWMSLCDEKGAVENLGPGNPGHSSHTHCAF